jgi:hypothetical protein
MADRGKHASAQRVDRFDLAEVADDGGWLLGQLLEDGLLELGSVGQVKPTSQGQHHTALLAGLLELHRQSHPAAVHQSYATCR